MRAFLALEVPEAVGAEVERRLGRVRRSLPPARWVAPQSLHLTLAFLGEVEPGEVQALLPSLSTAFADSSAMTLHVRGIGSFPKRMPARVIWAEIEAEGDLESLHERVATAIREVRGENGEVGRPFRPHLTLARCRPPWPSSAVEKLRTEFGGPLSPEGFQIAAGTLFESKLGPRGARYRVIRTFPLGVGG